MASSAFDEWLQDYLLKCFWENHPPDVFTEALHEGMIQHDVPMAALPKICRQILQIGCRRLDNCELAFDYVEFFYILENIDYAAYLECLATFSIVERLDSVHILIQRLKVLVCNMNLLLWPTEKLYFSAFRHSSYGDELEGCNALCKKVFTVLRILVEALFVTAELTVRAVEESAVLVELKPMDDGGSLLDDFSDVDEATVRATTAALDGIGFLPTLEFTRLAIYFHITSERENVEEFLEMSVKVRKCCELLIEKISQGAHHDFMTECFNNAQLIFDSFESFAIAPDLEWKHIKDDFIRRKFRPTILTLGSIFATFRVLKTKEEIAESFLVVGDAISIPRRQIVFDILRSGFLIQMETATSGRPEVSAREPMTDAYVFLRIPLILAHLIKLGVSSDDVYAALTQMSHCSTLLNELDSKLFGNSFLFVIDKLEELEVLNEAQHTQLSENRKLGIERNLALTELLQDSGASRPKSRIQILVVAQKAKKVFGMEDWSDMDKKIERLMQNVSYIDLICAVCCADEDLPAFTSNLASINYQTQDPSNATAAATNRVYIFDSTFILLSRIAMVWEDLRLEDLVGDNIYGVFYNWMKRYIHSLDMNEPMPVDAHLKMNFLDQFNLLKSSTPFWNETWDFASLIDHIPLIGNYILDEYKKENFSESNIYNILATFRRMACLLLCLVQWLETQPASAAKRAFSQTLRNFGNSRGQDPADKLLYTILVERKCSKQMAEGRRQREQPYTWVINFAQRHPPNIAQNLDEAPDLQMLKEAFLYSNQQGWANADVIALINRCNREVKQREWCTCWMKQMLKAWTSDEMNVASELCLSAALTSPVPCLLEIVHRLVDFVLFSSSAAGTASRGKISLETFSNTSTSLSATSSSVASSSSFHHSPNYVNVEFHKASGCELARMLIRTLVLLIWAEDRRKIDRRRRAQRNASRKRKLEKSTKPIADLSLKSEKQIKCEPAAEEDATQAANSISGDGEKDAVLETIMKVFERFDNMIRSGRLKPAVTFVIFFIHELTKAPKTVYRQRLIDLMPLNMIFLLARIDAAALPIQMFLKLYDVTNQNNRERCLKYTCMMRKLDLI